jgi:hypothetical protein
MVLLDAEQRCNVVCRIGAEIDSVASVVHRCEISISVNPLTVYIAELTVNTRMGTLFRGINSMRFQKTIAAFVAIVGVSSSALGQNTDNYPRLGGMYGGGAQNYDPGFQTYAARLHIVVISGSWPGWETSRGYTKQTVISSIKAQSTIGTRVFQWAISTDTYDTNPALSGNPVYSNKANAMNWWLYVSGTSGPYVYGLDGVRVLINMTAASPRDPTTGLGPYGWGAKYSNDTFHLGLTAGVSACPSLDGFFLDDLGWTPQNDADWLRNGTTQSQTDPTTQLNVRTGEKTFYDEMKAIFPSGVHMGNVSTWGGATSLSPLNGVLGGGMNEHVVGVSQSNETAYLQYYVGNVMNALAAPKYMIFSHDGVTATGSDAYGPNWQAMRFGLTAALMNNGYYYANTNSAVYDDSAANRLWFDEYDGGGRGVGYLGQPLSNAAGAVQTAAWSNGVWKREFANGIALWNPKGNGAHSVSLSGLGNLKHFSGSQNPSLNNGSTVTNGSVTLQDRDGLILMRLTPVAIPDPPTAVQIQ